ncbi:MAG: right-handed parallel beta-helix repeat-containing protein, partial [Candidatus Omnitrophica bacterium]|nr:right-handed parallel beta-helix repeat-containing protein [Candidatus Omnitrophota bacterium]
SFNLTSIQALDRYDNLANGANGATAFSGAKTLAYSLASGIAHGLDGTSDTYTSAVSFSFGVSTTLPVTTLYRAQSGVSIIADDVTAAGSLPNLEPHTASSTFTVNPAAASNLAVSGITDPITSGNSSAVTVHARDPYANTVTGYLGAIRFTSSDAKAALPADYTFQAGDQGIHTFTNALTLRTAGEHSITATDIPGDFIGVDNITGQQASVTVEAGGISYFKVTLADGVTQVHTMRAGETVDLKIAAYDINNNIAVSFSGVKTLILSGPSAGTEGNSPFVTDNTGAPIDIGQPTPITFTSGVSSPAVILKAFLEEDITVSVAEGPVSSAGHSLRLIVTENDANKLKFITVPISSVSAGTVWPGIQVAVFDAFGNMINTGSFDIAVTENGSQDLMGTLAKTYTVDAITFDDLSYTKAETLQVTFNASLPLAPLGTTVTVKPGVETHLKLTTFDDRSSHSMTTDESLALKITAQDPYGNIAIGFGGLKNIIFSGLSIGPELHEPTVAGLPLDAKQSINFVGGISRSSSALVLRVYRQESAALNVASLTLSSRPDTQLNLTVSPGSANKLKFSANPPSNVIASAVWPGFAVSIYDAYGNATGTGADAITIHENHATADFLGTHTKNAVSGTATFDDIGFPTAGIINVSASSGTLLPPPPQTVTITSTAPTISIVDMPSPPPTQINETGIYNVYFRYEDPQGGVLKLEGFVSKNDDPGPVGLEALGIRNQDWFLRGEGELGPHLGAFTWTTSFNSAGVYDFSFIARDVNNPQRFGTTSPPALAVVNTNRPPLASTEGTATTAVEGTQVTLIGTASSDPDGDLPLTYLWTQTAGTAVTLLPSSSHTSPTFIAPDVGFQGETLTFELAVTDSLGLPSTIKAAASLVVTFIDQPPVAIVTNPPSQINEEATVQLDGVASYDPDGQPITHYYWLKVTGPDIAFNPPGNTAAESVSAAPSFVVPNVEANGVSLIIHFRVGINPPPVGSPAWSEPFVLNMTINNLNQPPIATTIGSAKEANEGNLVQLVGTASSDPDNNLPLTYRWRQTGGPLVTLAPTVTAPSPTFTAPDVGPQGASLSFELTVTDSLGVPSNLAIAIVQVNFVDQLPVALMGNPPSMVNEGDTLALDGAASFDPDGQPITNYRWLKTLGPDITFNPPGTILSESLSASPSFIVPEVGPEGGRIVIQFWAGTSPTVWSDPFVLDIAVKNVENHAPILDLIGSFDIPAATAFAKRFFASDIDGDSLFFSASLDLDGDDNYDDLISAVDATFTDNGNGTADFRWTPPVSRIGTYKMRVTVIDDGAPIPAGDLENFVISVAQVGINQPPVTLDDNLVVLTGSTNNPIRLGARDDGLPNGTLSFTIATPLTNEFWPDGPFGSLYDNGVPIVSFPHQLSGGTVTYTPDPTFADQGTPVNFTFKASDGELQSENIGVVTITATDDSIVEFVYADRTRRPAWDPPVRGRDLLFIKIADPAQMGSVAALPNLNHFSPINRLTQDTKDEFTIYVRSAMNPTDYACSFSMDATGFRSGIYSNAPSGGIALTTQNVDTEFDSVTYGNCNQALGLALQAKTGDELVAEYKRVSGFPGPLPASLVVSNEIYVNTISLDPLIPTSLARVVGLQAASYGDVIKFLNGLAPINLNGTTFPVFAGGITIDGSANWNGTDHLVEIRNSGEGSFIIYADTAIRGVKFVHDGCGQQIECDSSKSVNIIQFDAQWSVPNSTQKVFEPTRLKIGGDPIVAGSNYYKPEEGVTVIGGSTGIRVYTRLPGSRTVIQNAEVKNTLNYGIEAVDTGNFKDPDNNFALVELPQGVRSLQILSSQIESNLGHGIQMFNVGYVDIQNNTIVNNAGTAVNLETKLFGTFPYGGTCPDFRALGMCEWVDIGATAASALPGDGTGGVADAVSEGSPGDTSGYWSCPFCDGGFWEFFADLNTLRHININANLIERNKWGVRYSAPPLPPGYEQTGPFPEAHYLKIGIPGRGNMITFNGTASEGAGIDFDDLSPVWLSGEGRVDYDNITWEGNVIYKNFQGIVTDGFSPSVGMALYNEIADEVRILGYASGGPSQNTFQLYMNLPGEVQGRYIIPASLFQVAWENYNFTISTSRASLVNILSADPINTLYNFTIINTKTFIDPLDNPQSLISTGFSSPKTISTNQPPGIEITNSPLPVNIAEGGQSPYVVELAYHDKENVSLLEVAAQVDRSQGAGWEPLSVLPGPYTLNYAEGTGHFEWLPDFTAAGTYKFKFTVRETNSEERLSSLVETPVLTVGDTNRAPYFRYITISNDVFLGNAFLLLDDDKPHPVVINGYNHFPAPPTHPSIWFSIQAYDPDTDNQLTTEIVSGNEITDIGQVMSADSTFTWTLLENQISSGIFNVRLRVRDNSPMPLSDEHDLQIIITRNIDTPVTGVRIQPWQTVADRIDVGEGEEVPMTAVIEDNELPGDLIIEWTYSEPNNFDHPVGFTNSRSDKTTVIFPQVPSPKTYTIKVDITDIDAEDRTRKTVSDTITVSVWDRDEIDDPIISVAAMNDLTVMEGQQNVALTAITDDDEVFLLHEIRWEQIPPASDVYKISIADPNTLNTTFNTPLVDADKTFTLRITVIDRDAEDGTSTTVTDEVLVTVQNDINSADDPIQSVTAMPDVRIFENESELPLTATILDDEPPEFHLIRWTQISPDPQTLRIGIINPNALNTTFDAPIINKPEYLDTETFVLQIGVTDIDAEDGITRIEKIDTVEITVMERNILDNPILNLTTAGVLLAAEGTLNIPIGATIEDDESPAMHRIQWAQVGGPDPPIRFENANVLETFFDAPLVNGNQERALHIEVVDIDAEDGTESVASGWVITTILETGRSDEPIQSVTAAMIGPVDEGSQSNSLTATVVDDESPLSHEIEWVQISPESSVARIFINNPALLNTTFDAPLVGTNTVFLLEVRVVDTDADDGTRTTVTDQVQITVRDIGAIDDPILSVTAMADISLDEGATARPLTASIVDDEPPAAHTIQWIQISPNPAILSLPIADPAMLDTTFDAPFVNQETVFILEIRVTDLDIDDNTATTVSDQVQITVRNTGENDLPIVSVTAMADVIVDENSSLHPLSAAINDDEPPSAHSIQWVQLSPDPQIRRLPIAEPTRLVSTFDAPLVRSNEVYVLEVRITDTDVDDGSQKTVTDQVQITVQDLGDLPPVVSAGADQSLASEASGKFAGSVRDDSTIMVTEWRLTDTAGTSFTIASFNLSDVSNPTATFQIPVVHQTKAFEFTLVAQDGVNPPVTDAMHLTVTGDGACLPPTVNAGADITGITEGETGVLNATVISECISPAQIRWEQVDHLEIAFVGIQNASVANPAWTAPEVINDTIFTFKITVTNSAEVVSDTLTVQILDQPGEDDPPIVDAGANVTGAAEQSIGTLNATIFDDGVSPINILWTQENQLRLDFGIHNSTVEDPSWTAPEVITNTTFTFKIAVTDAAGSAADTVTIQVVDQAGEDDSPYVTAGSDFAVTEKISGSAFAGAVIDDTPNVVIRWILADNAGTSYTIENFRLSNVAHPTATFRAPAVPQEKTFTFALEVDDRINPKVADVVMVTVRDDGSGDELPAVDAGATLTVSGGSQGRFRGSVSDDTPGVEIVWTLTNAGGTSFTIDDFRLSNVSDPVSTFTAPQVLEDKSFVFTLTADDHVVGHHPVSDAVTVLIVEGASISFLDNNGEIRDASNPPVRGKDRIFVRVKDESKMGIASLEARIASLEQQLPDPVTIYLEACPLGADIFTNYPNDECRRYGILDVGREFTTPGPLSINFSEAYEKPVQALTGWHVVTAYDHDLGSVSTEFVVTPEIYVNNVRSAANWPNSLMRTVTDGGIVADDVVKFMQDIRNIDLRGVDLNVLAEHVTIDATGRTQMFEIRNSALGAFLIWNDAVVKGLKFVHRSSLPGASNIIIYDALRDSAPDSNITQLHETDIVGGDVGVLVRTSQDGSKVSLNDARISQTKEAGIKAFNVGNQGIFTPGDPESYALQVTNSVIEDTVGTSAGVKLMNASHVNLIDNDIISSAPSSTGTGVEIAARTMEPTDCTPKTMPDGTAKLPADCEQPLPEEAKGKTEEIVFEKNWLDGFMTAVRMLVPSVPNPVLPPPQFHSIKVGSLEPEKGNIITNSQGQGNAPGVGIDVTGLSNSNPLPEGQIVHDLIMWHGNVMYGNDKPIGTPFDWGTKPVHLTGIQFSQASGLITIAGELGEGVGSNIADESFELFANPLGENQGRYYIPSETLQGAPVYEVLQGAQSYQFEIRLNKNVALGLLPDGEDPANMVYTVVRTSHERSPLFPDVADVRSSKFSHGIRVGDPRPVISFIPSNPPYAVNAGANLAFTVSASDGVNVAVMMDSKTLEGNAIPASVAYNSVTGQFNWPTAAADRGTYHFVFSATDPSGQTVSAAVEVKVL